MIDERIHNATILRIVLAVWPEAENLSALELAPFYADVREIIDGRATPRRSREERERVKSAWVDEAPRSSTPPRDEHFEYRWAASKARSDSLSVAELEAAGWTVEHVDPRYGNSLMRKALP